MRLNSVRGRDCGKRDVAMRIADIEELKALQGGVFALACCQCQATTRPGIFHDCESETP